MEDELADTLRREARGLAEVLRDVVLAEAPGGAVDGVYLKGSSVRPWTSRIDYVPEVSDVDVHVRVHAEAKEATRSLAFALRVADGTQELFNQRFPRAMHSPRPQLFFLGDIEEMSGYLPSTPDSVVVLHGNEYRAGTESEYAACVADDRTRFLADADFVRDNIAGKIIDRPGKLAWQAVASLTWRVAPAGPRLLTQLGRTPYDVWAMNRTSVTRTLQSLRHGEVAAAYAGFYLAAWDGYLTGFEDARPALRAVEAAHRLFSTGRRLIESADGRAATQGGHL
jgi:hypothetical protein